MSLLVKVCTAVQVFALPRLIAATTEPVVGEIVSVPLPLSATERPPRRPNTTPRSGLRWSR